ncbi:MAG: MgtC/SapB family protein [Clostridia bacterium]|nr:MgtC/SapB family protein [Clostridia bacterium]
MQFNLIVANPLTSLDLLLRIAIAIIIGCAVGVEREYKNRPAGLRTHVLVSLGACSIALIECLFSASLSPATDPHVSYNFGRLCAQVISGIGFLGAGTIFMQQKKIAGLTTAASLWNTACMGLATGYGYYWMSLICCVLVLLSLCVLQKMIRVNAIKRVEVRFIHRSTTIEFINNYFQESGIKVLDMDFHIEAVENKKTDDPNVYTNIYTLHLPASLNYAVVINHLSSYRDIQLVRTTNT